MKQFVKTLIAVCDECGDECECKMYRYAFAQSVFDADTYAALCPECNAKEEVEDEIFHRNINAE